MSLNFESEFYRRGLLKTITIKHISEGKSYELINMTMETKLTDEQSGKVIAHSKQDHYFTEKEFKEFVSPLVNYLKENLHNESNSNSVQD